MPPAAMSGTNWRELTVGANPNRLVEVRVLKRLDE
jgi:hypothetical protein